MSSLHETFRTTIIPQLGQELAIRNVLAVPRIEKIVVNVGWGELKGNESLQKSVSESLSLITGQKPVVTKAKKAIAGFKLRENDLVGFRITLRGKRMYDFLDRLITYVFPRLRDFQGIAVKGFDGHGNFSFGLREQTVFPEIPFQSNDRTWGMQVTIVTSSPDDRQAQVLLKHLGFPFTKTESA
jgi:large subunit ribosomal protein L5